MEKQQQAQQSQTLIILCDKVFYQRLKSVQQDESMKISMFPLRNTAKKSLSLVIFDLIKTKSTKDVKQFQQQKEFVQICQQMRDGLRALQILTYSVPKETIQHFINGQHKSIKISGPELRQLNQFMRQSVILTLKLPYGFYQENDCHYTLEGYKFNSIGKITQGWSYLSNGRILKAIFAKQDEKISTQLKENILYSKNEIKKILQSIKIITNVGQYQQQEKKSRLIEDLKVLGENYCHSEKFVTTSNGLIPILNFEVEILCSMTRGESCKNKLVKETAKDCPKVFHHLCVNFSESLQRCEDIINKKIEEIFTEDKTILSKQSQQNLSLTLSTIPTKISNPHLFLKTQSKNKFQQFYVKGFYEYFHYGDHNFNDQGWGCAYRSLETLLSWFKLQQKLQLLTVPTVSEIQNLIDIIDCTSQHKISNTNTWIGATEVSWVVKKLTGYDCRIIHIQDGKDIVEHAQIFRDHLQNVGTPIMYGGGEYAYSIVGINYSWKLGEIMFLILDPHYSGSDKIQKIIEKKGICWRKPQEMFKKGVFYNFCLPIL